MMVDWFPKEVFEGFPVEHDRPRRSRRCRGRRRSQRRKPSAVAPPVEDQKVGWIEDSFANGVSLILPADREEAVVAHFNKFGIKCFRNDTLLGWAHGEGWTVTSRRVWSSKTTHEASKTAQVDEEKSEHRVTAPGIARIVGIMRMVWCGPAAEVWVPQVQDHQPQADQPPRIILTIRR